MRQEANLEFLKKQPKLIEKQTRYKYAILTMVMKMILDRVSLSGVRALVGTGVGVRMSSARTRCITAKSRLRLS